MGYDLYSLTPARDWEETAKEAQKVLGPLPERASIDDVAACINKYYERLESAGDYVRFNVHWWPAILDIAVNNGWKPKRELEYYLRNEGQTVTKDDALALSCAIEAALGSDKVPPFLETKVEKLIALCRRDGFQIW